MLLHKFDNTMISTNKFRIIIWAFISFIVFFKGIPQKAGLQLS
ncbi:hypothetical protein GA0116948_10166 [Chitinophaga costaii]|uniref:Uncharacterized protein n=1 Tax=Chitinophaga costaii TaxID=1335309 RepID=A0A1C3YRG9_9BACT|nr:hypothetical protein GA0116948_10166 [Chitinophaga costaii]